MLQVLSSKCYRIVALIPQQYLLLCFAMSVLACLREQQCLGNMNFYRRKNLLVDSFLINYKKRKTEAGDTVAE